MIAFITARGGSKGLPRKNILPFNGVPLIAYTILAASESDRIDRIVVSTDDYEIASVAREFGADVPFLRPASLATDVTSSRDVLLHALSFMEKESNPVDMFCVLQPTSPLRTSVDIDNACRLFCEKEADSVLSITPYAHPIEWAVDCNHEGCLSLKEPSLIERRQSSKCNYHLNGAIYAFRTSFFNRTKSYFGDRTYGYLMPPERSVDIDSIYDFVAAEAIARYRDESN